MKTTYKKGGYDQKYIILKRDGTLADENADYFVLRLDKDPCALKALETYKKEVEKFNKEFSRDLEIILNKYK